MKYYIFLSNGYLHICNTHTGKMEFMLSLSTTSYFNNYCRTMQKNNNSVCSKCYAQKMAENYNNFKECYYCNDQLLNKGLFNDKDLAKLENCFHCYPQARIEAFGEVESVVQARNYIKIVKANPKTFFGIWSKRLNIWKRAFKLEGGKPENCNFIASSPLFDTPLKITSAYKEMIDGVFTVYRKSTVKKGEVKINCGTKRCIDCMKCYSKQDRVFFISEEEK